MNATQIVSKLTLEEKASLCSGLNFWQTKPVERLGVPSVLMTDGPHGLRKQSEAADHLGLNASVPATCFPAGCATACSFDDDLLKTLGEAIGDECNAERVSMILGPSLNIKRSPLCGRNFEYFSEDPYLSGRMAAAHVKGVQAKNVSACPKHFAANSQENRRFSADSQMDERTLREIYLPAFERVVKDGRAWSMMCSYNRVNGEYAARHHRLLTEILRDEWGFDGFVVSDWGATNDRVKCLAAGMDLEMPASGGYNDRLIVEAVRNGALDEKVLDTACKRMLEFAFRNRKDDGDAPTSDLDAHDDLATRIAAESMVLLSNDGVLPLKDNQDVCFVGEFFEKPRIQGGGSSHINAYRITSGRSLMPNAPYAKGFSLAAEQVDRDLIDEAVKLCEAHEVCVVFAGLPDAFESEGYDREHMDMPANQSALIEALAKTGKKVVVVLSNGSPVEMPWADSVSAILEAYLGGQAAGRAALELLYGKRNPCAKLAETFPMKLSDTPCYPWYNRNLDDAPYHEGVLVGYRYYDLKQMPVRFPFGHGLSYTQFEYSNLKLDKASTDGSLIASVTVKNVGSMRGKEIVQLYVAAPDTGITRAPKELKGFAKLDLVPGESKTITMKLDRRSFAYFCEQTGDWFVAPGTYGILIGKSSRDIVLSADVDVISADKLPTTVTADSLIGDLMKDPRVAPIFQQIMANSPLLQIDKDDATGLGRMFERMVQYMPLRSTAMMGMSPDQLGTLIATIKAAMEG